LASIQLGQGPSLGSHHPGRVAVCPCRLAGIAWLRPEVHLVIPIAMLSWAAVGCSRPETVEVDLSATPARFVIDHAGWPRPFWWPRVTEFAIGSEEDDLLWQVQATSAEGELAHKLAFVYGEVPPAFMQVSPPPGKAPKPLIGGRAYYVGAIGPKAVYRAVFALPISPAEVSHRERTTSPAPDQESPSTMPATSHPSRIAPIPKPDNP
jgi:hypothetical protein